MSRTGRIQSESDIYHVTARGVGKQVIFEDDRDRRKFGKTMRDRLDECNVELYAWCFMQNHIHLLLHCPLSTMSSFMRLLLSDYARYYNWRYDRVGHLFEKRFDSKPVIDERQLLATIRYIHQNPHDLGVTDFSAYPWSSYREYIGAPFISSTALPLELFGSREAFADSHKIIETDPKLEPGYTSIMQFSTDDEAIERAKLVTGCFELTDIAAADKRTRDSMLFTLKSDGFTIRQISRLTGIGRSIIQRAKAD